MALRLIEILNQEGRVGEIDDISNSLQYPRQRRQ
jgi:hypothetical protein